MVAHAVGFLSDDATTWWRNLRESSRPVTWQEFSESIKQRFLPLTESETARDDLWNLRQTTSVAVYSAKFSTIVAAIDDMGDADQLDRYIHGLKAPLQLEMKRFPPQSLKEAMNMAERLDQHSFQPDRPFPPRRHAHGTSQGPSPMELNGAKVDRPRGPLTAEEKAYRDKHNLCRYCGKAGHSVDTCRLVPKNTR